MNPFVCCRSSKQSNPRSAGLMNSAEQELAAFFNAVKQLFGREQAELSAKDWLDELAGIDGLPAAVQEEAGERRVVALENGQWVAKAQVFLGDAKDAPAAGLLKVLMIGAEPYVFCPKGDTLYCHEGLPGKDVRFPADWETVGLAGEMWAAAANEGRPEAFTARTDKEKLSTEIVGLWREPAESAPPGAAHGPSARAWKPAFSRVSPFPLRTLGAASDAAGCRVAYQALQWTLNVVQLDGEKTISARRFGDMNPADRARALAAGLSSGGTCAWH